MEEKALRPLTLEESKKEKDQKEGRTDYERRAYRWLPDGMKKCAQRNPGVAFVGHSAYYPDLFFPEQKLCIEIDGGIHLNQKDYDASKDRIFKKHGYEIVRIFNADTIEDIAFGECLLYKLRKIDNIDNRILVKPFINELQQTIQEKREDMLRIDDNDNYISDDFVLPLFDHKLMQRRLHYGDSLNI